MGTTNLRRLVFTSLKPPQNRPLHRRFRCKNQRAAQGAAAEGRRKRAAAPSSSIPAIPPQRTPVTRLPRCSPAAPHLLQSSFPQGTRTSLWQPSEPTRWVARVNSSRSGASPLRLRSAAKLFKALRERRLGKGKPQCEQVCSQAAPGEQFVSTSEVWSPKGIALPLCNLTRKEPCQQTGGKAESEAESSFLHHDREQRSFLSQTGQLDMAF